MTGARFVAVHAVEPAMLRDCDESQLRRELPDRSIIDVGRVGKFLTLRLDGEGDFYLTLHLGMTGQILVGGTDSTAAVEAPPGAVLLRPPPAGIARHTRFVFALDKPGRGPVSLEFRDMRKFGRVHLTAGGPAPRLRALGPDAWTGTWDAAYLAGRLRHRTAPIKAFLLDQRNLAGIGNIYADETLWWSQIAPIRRCGTLTEDEIGQLAVEIRKRLQEGVERLGCTLADFVDIEGRPGTFQELLQAYGRQGQTCRRCGSIIIRVIVAGRGTAYCPGCQF